MDNKPANHCHYRGNDQRYNSGYVQIIIHNARLTGGAPHRPVQPGLGGPTLNSFELFDTVLEMDHDRVARKFGIDGLVSFSQPLNHHGCGDFMKLCFHGSQLCQQV